MMQAQLDRERRGSYSPGVLFLLQAALLLGLVPLLSGIGIFVVWFITRGDVWPELGIVLMFFFGPALFLVGTICLVWHGVRAFREKSLRWLPILGTGALLLLNFPAAVAITFAAMMVDSELRTFD